MWSSGDEARESCEICRARSRWGREWTVALVGYNYLGVLEFDDVLNDEMKVKLKGEYSRMVKRSIYLGVVVLSVFKQAH